MKTLQAAVLAIVMATLGMFGNDARAQAYPSRPVRLIVPYAPGGGVDILARIIAPKLSELLGQQVVVENRGGGGGTIGAAAVAHSAPDGYTLLLGAIEIGSNPALHEKLPYDTLKDLQPVTLVATLPASLVIDPKLPVTTVADFIKLAKSEPGKLNYASAGIGSMHHLGAELFKASNDLDIVHVPYQSGGQAMTAILGGQAQMAISTVPPVLQQIKAGKLRALAVVGAKRQPALPDVPTFAEAGYPGFDVSLWQGVLVPAGTPPAVVAKLNTEINRRHHGARGEAAPRRDGRGRGRHHARAVRRFHSRRDRALEQDREARDAHELSANPLLEPVTRTVTRE